MSTKSLKQILENLFSIHRANACIIIRLFGFKITLKNIFTNQLADCCCIPNLQYLKNQGVHFAHPVGIVIHPNVEVGANVTIYQNVTIGDGKFNPETQRTYPKIGNDVIIYANSVIIGGINVGNNTIIGAGSVVTSDVPDNSIVAGNPAKVIHTIE